MFRPRGLQYCWRLLHAAGTSTQASAPWRMVAAAVTPALGSLLPAGQPGDSLYSPSRKGGVRAIRSWLGCILGLAERVPGCMAACQLARTARGLGFSLLPGPTRPC